MQESETSRGLNLFKNCLPSCVRRQSSPDLPNITMPQPETTEKPNSLLTWPANQLRETIANIITSKNAVISAETFDEIQRIVETELESNLPIESFEEQYDFCVVCSTDDYEDAEKFSNELVEKFGLTGFVVKETLGTDRFNTFEKSARKSTRILFFVTEQFNQDVFCSHLIKILCTPAGGKSYSSKVIPVMGSLGVEAPAPLRIVNKLLWKTTESEKSTQFELSVPLVFSDWVKQARIDRVEEKKKLLDQQRLQIMDKLVNEKLGVFV